MVVELPPAGEREALADLAGVPEEASAAGAMEKREIETGEILESFALSDA